MDQDDLVGIQASLIYNSRAMEHLSESNNNLARNFARGRRQFRVLMVTLVVLVAILVVNIVAVANLLSVSHTIRAQTSPARVRANQQQLKNIEQLLITCENNHTDRLAASVTGHPVPPLATGCPSDSLAP